VIRISVVLTLFVVMIVGAAIIADYLPRIVQPVHLSCPECPPCPVCQATVLPEPVKKIKPFIELCEHLGSTWVWIFDESGEGVLGACMAVVPDELKEPTEDPPTEEGPEEIPGSIDL
jgi:hypothetical protein